MEDFYYVISEQDANKLMSLGYELLKEDKYQNLWIFQRNENLAKFSSDDELKSMGIHYSKSRTLSF